MASFLLFGLPIRDPLAIEGSSGPCLHLSRMLSGFLWPVGSSPSAWGPTFIPPGSPIGWPCCGFSGLFRLLSRLPPPLLHDLAGCVLSRELPASLGYTVSTLWSVPSVGGFSLWRGLLLLAFPLLLLGFCEWLLPWVLSVFLRLSAIFLGSVLLHDFILPFGFSSFASLCAPQYRSVIAFSCFFVHWLVSSRVFGCLLSLSLLSTRFPCGVLPFSRWVVFSSHLPFPLLFFGVRGSSPSFRRLIFLFF